MSQMSPQSVASAPTLRRFAKREDGSLIIFSLFMFVLMLMVAGISLDVERFETARTKLQATSDGAALAAASLNQDMAADAVVQSHFDVAGMTAFLEDTHIIEKPGSKHVTIETDITVPTHFMNMVGVNALAAPVSSVAMEQQTKVEISLVLDVSGSMGANGRMANLRTAGGDFIDAVYSKAPADVVSTSIVPYSTQVSVGHDVLRHIPNLEDAHDLSSCLDFSAQDFNSTAIDFMAIHEQTPHFDARSNWWTPGADLWITECPTEDWTDALILSQDTTALKNYISALQPTAWTSIEMGMKWGAALLDPSFNQITNGLVQDGIVDAAFANRPVAMDQDETMKVMVVMTDGVNTDQYKIHPAFRKNRPSNVYIHTDANGQVFYNVYTRIGNAVPGGVARTGTNMWYVVNYGEFRDAPAGGNDIQRLTWNELWTHMPMRTYVEQILPAMGPIHRAIARYLSAVAERGNWTTKDPRLLSTCSAAKQSGITVYAIGFEAPNSSQALLAQCASTPSHYFNVEGTEIGTAFAAIASDISRLRLVN